MIITGKEGSVIVCGDIQPNGIDLRVKNVYNVLDKGIDEKVIDDDYIELVKFYDGVEQEITNYEDPYIKSKVKTIKPFWILEPHKAYLFQIDTVDLSRENTKIPLVGYVVPKSRFCRCGLSVHSALWDTGYIGAGKVLVVNHSDKTQKIYKDMYFAQIIFMVSKNGNMTYSGSHQNEGLK